MSNKKKKYKIGLVLGGGGARGFAHLGVYKALEEKGIKPDIISGTSAGAIMGAFIADGKSAQEIFEILTQKSLFKYSKFRFFSDGFIRLEGLKEDIRKNISAEKIEDLKIPLIITATNLNKGEVHYFEKGDLFEAVIASASIPILFTPMEINGDKYIDGGMFDNLPVKVLKQKSDFTIGVNISPIQFEDNINGFKDIAARTFQLCTHANTGWSREICDLLIEPKKLNNYHILEIDKAKEMFDIGYEAAINIDLSSIK